MQEELSHRQTGDTLGKVRAALHEARAYGYGAGAFASSFVALAMLPLTRVAPAPASFFAHTAIALVNRQVMEHKLAERACPDMDEWLSLMYAGDHFAQQVRNGYRAIRAECLEMGFSLSDITEDKQEENAEQQSVEKVNAMAASIGEAIENWKNKRASRQPKTAAEQRANAAAETKQLFTPAPVVVKEPVQTINIMELAKKAPKQPAPRVTVDIDVAQPMPIIKPADIEKARTASEAKPAHTPVIETPALEKQAIRPAAVAVDIGPEPVVEKPKPKPLPPPVTVQKPAAEKIPEKAVVIPMPVQAALPPSPPPVSVKPAARPLARVVDIGLETVDVQPVEAKPAPVKPVDAPKPKPAAVKPPARKEPVQKPTVQKKAPAMPSILRAAGELASAVTGFVTASIENSFVTSTAGLVQRMHDLREDLQRRSAEKERLTHLTRAAAAEREAERESLRLKKQQERALAAALKEQEKLAAEAARLKEAEQKALARRLDIEAAVEARKAADAQRAEKKKLRAAEIAKGTVIVNHALEGAKTALNTLQSRLHVSPVDVGDDPAQEVKRHILSVYNRTSNDNRTAKLPPLESVDMGVVVSDR